MKESKTVPCKYCTMPTQMTGTHLCDRCYELETRIRSNTELADKITRSIKKEKGLDPQTKDDFIYYLKMTLIPDLRASGTNATAEDFETAIRWINSDDIVLQRAIEKARFLDLKMYHDHTDWGTIKNLIADLLFTLIGD